MPFLLRGSEAGRRANRQHITMRIGCGTITTERSLLWRTTAAGCRSAEAAARVREGRRRSTRQRVAAGQQQYTARRDLVFTASKRGEGEGEMEIERLPISKLELAESGDAARISGVESGEEEDSSGDG